MRNMIFADWYPPTAKVINTFAQCGISDVILGISTSRSRFKLNYNTKKWIDAAKAIVALDMGVHYMTWSIAKPKAVLDGLHGMADLHEKCPAKAWWQNAESTWQNAQIDNVRAATHELVNYKKETPDCPLFAVVGLDRLHSKVAVLAEACDWICPEAYSFWNPEKGHWSHSSWTFPAIQQRRAYDSWNTRFPDKGLVMGMACYFEARPASGLFPGCSAAQSRRWAISEVVTIRDEMVTKNQNFVGTAYWSGKFVDGASQSENERREFFKKAAKL